MNWKLLAGILIVFGAGTEFFAQMREYNTGVIPSHFFIPQLLCGAAVCGGTYLIYKGKQKKREL